MSDEEQAQTDNEPPNNLSNNIGKVEWMDLTVDDATRVRDFYAKVVGWSPEDVSMGSYDDFNMNLPDSKTTVAGICHARGSNENVPAQWLMYVRVADATESATICKEKGGKVLDGPKRMGSSNYAIIEDPAGAVMALVSD